MQSSVECPVCVEVYIPRTRPPKLLACGHGICEHCIQSLLSTSSGHYIDCPKCRTRCDIPDGTPGKLPTNYPILGLIDTLCGECNDRPHTQVCGHCPLSLCDSCLENHQGAASNANVTNGIRTRINDTDATSTDVNQVPDYSAAIIKATFEEGLTEPSGVCVDPETGKIYVTDFSENAVFVLSPGLQFIQRFGSSGLDEDEYDSPFGVVAYRENVYVSDVGNNRIHMTDVQGSDVLTFGSYGSGKDYFQWPRGISVDRSGQVYICDYDNRRIKVVDTNQATAREFGRDVFPDDPMWIATSAEDKIAVTTKSGENIYLFTSHGKPLKRLRTSVHGIDAAGVVFDSRGHLLVADCQGGRVAVMTQNGDVLNFIGSPGSAPDQLMNPQGLTVTREGDIVVCDTGNNRVQLYQVPKRSP